MSVALSDDVHAVVRELSTEAREMLHQLGVTIAAAFGGPSHPRFRRTIASMAASIDGELRELVRPPSDDSGICVLRGVAIEQQVLGQTPPIWAAVDETAGLPLDIQMMLLAAMIGRPFGWHGQQEGRFVNNVVPARGYENVQTGASSSVSLSPHTEDAFHPHRAHVFLLGCVRNPDRVATTISSVRHVDTTDADREILLRASVPIIPDLTYGAFTQQSARPVPTLWKRDDGLCLRYDPDYTPLTDAVPEFRSAYQRLGVELKRVGRAVVLEPGDVAIIDNDIAVHGRVPFKARFDGTDRWLKRINVAIPGRHRPSTERSESGYGQRIEYLFSELS